MEVVEEPNGNVTSKNNTDYDGIDGTEISSDNM